MSFGNDTIIFRHLVKSGVADELGQFTLVPQDTPAPGCRHRPLTFKEVVELEFDVSTEYWRSTLPLYMYDADLLETVMAAKSMDLIRVNGKNYQIVGGVRPHGDMASVPFKMTIISQRTDAQED